MIVIRPEQMEIFRRHALRDFIAYAADRLKTGFEKETASTSDEALEEFIWTGIERANSFGVARQLDVARFLEFQMRYGDDFDSVETLPGAGEILRSEELSGEEKIAELEALEEARNNF